MLCWCKNAFIRKNNFQKGISIISKLRRYQLALNPSDTVHFSLYSESAGNVTHFGALTNSSIKSAGRNGRFVSSQKKGAGRWEARDSLAWECLNRILRVSRWFIHLFDYFDQSDVECLSECRRSPDRRCLDNRFIMASRWIIGPAAAKLEALMGPLQWLIRGGGRDWKNKFEEFGDEMITL